MTQTPLLIGETPVNGVEGKGTGSFVKINSETFYKISGFDAMNPFFMTVVSSSDHWMFISSNGSLTAGRKNPDSSLFPYYTDDKIIDSPELTGSKTIFHVHQQGKRFLWEPFSERYAGAYRLERNLYKNKFGSKLIFEEVNLDLQLTFLYEWSFSNRFGFVKRSRLLNTGANDVGIHVLDGLQNLLPFGITSHLQTTRSTLADAYKKNELIPEVGMGIFALSSMIVDKAEPSEALSATTVWSVGLNKAEYLLSSQQLNAFRRGEEVHQETFTKACKASYFISAQMDLVAKEATEWYTVAELNQSTAKVNDLVEELQNENIAAALVADVEQCTKVLKKLVGLADGLQKSEDRLSTARHFSNVLYNIMRGGIFEDQYHIEIDDLRLYVRSINSGIYEDSKRFFDELPRVLTYKQLLTRVEVTGNIHLKRICTEYLPLSFSRRHGDPSRPWNSFSIELVDDQGHKKHNYEGNWRDIFQNWEALAYSFPEFIVGMMTKFVNASTVDGYNPYRITREGIDWEVIEPDDPWSYIGYWGDHQIIYLQKLMEHAQKHFPGLLARLLSENNFVYANVPYKIKGYQAIRQNPNDTIDFDHDQQTAAMNLAEVLGADGKLVWRDMRLVTANFAEKVLVMLLTKLYNFVPDGGIWLNTQRPEWNDANNALVGNGLSMVTLNYLTRSIDFVKKIFEESPEDEFEMHSALSEMINAQLRLFSKAAEKFSALERMHFVDALGAIGESYRIKAYNRFEEGTNTVRKQSIIELLALAKTHIDRTILNSKRNDGLYHAYNLLHFKSDGLTISTLYEMLEGQVAAISSGLLSPVEVVSVLDALKTSAMYRADQYSYMLYPNRVLATFITKNTIPEQYIAKSNILLKLKNMPNNGLIETDARGDLHFDGNLHNAKDVHRAIQHIKDVTELQVSMPESKIILEAFEAVFNHVAFTGRSGTFYGYEGLGSIYWHMVSKLLLAVQENIYKANETGAHKEIIGKLMDHYYEIRAGIGINKEPNLYGAFPTDAYSHTPGNAGAQQPGLTGQVKEDVINRFAELGIQVWNGKIHINPIILHQEEFLQKEERFEFVNTTNQFQTVAIGQNELAFTYCGTLFVYRIANKVQLRVVMQNGDEIKSKDLVMNAELSAEIFSRSGKIEKVCVDYSAQNLNG